MLERYTYVTHLLLLPPRLDELAEIVGNPAGQTQRLSCVTIGHEPVVIVSHVVVDANHLQTQENQRSPHHESLQNVQSLMLRVAFLAVKGKISFFSLLSEKMHIFLHSHSPELL